MTSWQKGVVAADHPLASEAGAEILDRGGNAVDAAVATSFCLSVVRPHSCGIGGGGFMLIHGRDTVAVDYRGRAPEAIDPFHFEKLGDPLASQFTGLAVTVPGTVAGLLRALERFGTLDRPTVLAPAIRAAEAGFAADRHHVQIAGEVIGWFAEDPARRIRHRFLWERVLGEKIPSEGDKIHLPEQADALRFIAERGAAAFYDGPIGEAIIDAVAAHGGVMTAEDLRSFAPVLTRPLRGSFRGRTLLSMPPPSSGGIAALEILGILERLEKIRGTRLEAVGHNTANYVHRVTEAMKHAFADRARWLGDPAFVDVPVERLLADVALREAASRIDPDHTLAGEDYGVIAPVPEDAGTSHFCVVDADGMGVSCTETINLEFGSRIAVERFGFFLNNDMDDFTTIRGEPNAFRLRQSDRNLPAPRKRPLSSMTPTILLDDRERVALMVGGSGGPRIITGVVQSLLNATVFGMGAADSVGSPRFHHQWWPHVLGLEAPPAGGRPFAGIEAALQAKGHETGPAEKVGAIQLIRRIDDRFDAASDPRKGGRPAGSSAGR